MTIIWDGHEGQHKHKLPDPANPALTTGAIARCDGCRSYFVRVRENTGPPYRPGDKTSVERWIPVPWWDWRARRRIAASRL